MRTILSYNEHIKNKEVMNMTFAEKLKSIRKQAGMSQEKLAEKLGVSRQAVTKWETDAGIPDIENIMAISALFDLSIDELLSNEKGTKNRQNIFLRVLQSTILTNRNAMI